MIEPSGLGYVSFAIILELIRRDIPPPLQEKLSKPPRENSTN
jgi:hypothetical protein